MARQPARPSNAVTATPSNSVIRLNTAADALAVAEGGKVSLGVTITDTEDGKGYTADEFRKRFGH